MRVVAVTKEIAAVKYGNTRLLIRLAVLRAAAEQADGDEAREIEAAVCEFRSWQWLRRGTRQERQTQLPGVSA